MDTDLKEHKNFPKPDRSDHRPQQNANNDYFPEIDIGFHECILDDGRPCRIEEWYDKELGFICRTFFYSTLDIENWQADQHFEYVERNDLLEDQADKYKGPKLGLKTIEDNSGNAVWSVTAVIKDEDYL